MTSIWIGVILLIPLLIMSVLGFYNWGVHGSELPHDFPAEGHGRHRGLRVGLVRGHVELHGVGATHLGR